MAGSKSSLTGEDFYGPYDAQETAQKHAEELGMQTVPSLNITYTEVTEQYLFGVVVASMLLDEYLGWASSPMLSCL